jgi:hypothetical protein
VVLLSAFVAAYRAVLPSLPGPIPAIITLTLMDLINTDFNELKEEGQEGGAFRRITAS